MVFVSFLLPDQGLVLICVVVSCLVVVVICVFICTVCARKCRRRRRNPPRKYHVMSEQDIPEELPMINSTLSDED